MNFNLGQELLLKGFLAVLYISTSTYIMCERKYNIPRECQKMPKLAKAKGVIEQKESTEESESHRGISILIVAVVLIK